MRYPIKHEGGVSKFSQHITATPLNLRVSDSQNEEFGECSGILFCTLLSNTSTIHYVLTARLC